MFLVSFLFGSCPKIGFFFFTRVALSLGRLLFPPKLGTHRFIVQLQKLIFVLVLIISFTCFLIGFLKKRFQFDPYLVVLFSPTSQNREILIASVSCSISGNVAALGKQKAVVAGRPDAKNRRALGEIGNVMNVRLPEGYVIRPIA